MTTKKEGIGRQSAEKLWINSERSEVQQIKIEEEEGREMSRMEDKQQAANARAYVIFLILLAFILSPDR